MSSCVTFSGRLPTHTAWRVPRGVPFVEKVACEGLARIGGGGGGAVLGSATADGVWYPLMLADNYPAGGGGLAAGHGLRHDAVGGLDVRRVHGHGVVGGGAGAGGRRHAVDIRRRDKAVACAGQ